MEKRFSHGLTSQLAGDMTVAKAIRPNDKRLHNQRIDLGGKSLDEQAISG
jgi:hypothetical protein